MKVSKFVVAAGMVVASIAGSSPDASACGGSWAPYEALPREEAISEAERLVMAGRYFTASLWAHHEFPHMNEWTNSTSPLETRAQKVMAIAVMRLDGNLTLGTPWRGWSADLRKTNLVWSVKALTALAETHADDPTLKSYLGEALAKMPERREDALAMLGDLAKRDLLVTPQGYQALAKLRQLSGDTEGRDAATKRCTTMASSPAVCQLPST